jgi:hypothetical protein
MCHWGVWLALCTAVTDANHPYQLAMTGLWYKGVLALSLLYTTSWDEVGRRGPPYYYYYYYYYLCI